MGFDHRLWQIVKLNYESMDANAPGGHVAQARSTSPAIRGRYRSASSKHTAAAGWIMLQSLAGGRNEPDVVASGRPTEALKLEHR